MATLGLRRQPEHGEMHEYAAEEVGADALSPLTMLLDECLCTRLNLGPRAACLLYKMREC